MFQFLFKVFIYLNEKVGREREGKKGERGKAGKEREETKRERGRQRLRENLLPGDLNPKCPQQVRISWAEFRRQELHPCFFHLCDKSQDNWAIICCLSG